MPWAYFSYDIWRAGTMGIVIPQWNKKETAYLKGCDGTHQVPYSADTERPRRKLDALTKIKIND